MADIISSNKVLAVEGKDEAIFFDALLQYVGISDVDIQSVGGKRQFKNKLPALVRMSGFSEVDILAVVRDADNDANAAFQSIREILRKEKLEPPNRPNQFSQGRPLVGIYIMPGNSDTGMLEDLCLKTVKNHPAMKCVVDFVNCVKKLDDPPNNITKAKAQVFLAAMPQIAREVGIGAQKGYWNFDADELDDLRTFINKLR